MVPTPSTIFASAHRVPGQAARPPIRWKVCAVVCLAAVIAVGCRTVDEVVSDVANDIDDDADWVPLLGPRATQNLTVMVLIDGRPVEAVLDTGAQHSMVTMGLVRELGLTQQLAPTPTSAAVVVGDAHGAVADGWRASLPSLSLGTRRFDALPVTVIDNDIPMMLVGYEVLRQFDLVVSITGRRVGLLPPGTAPTGGTTEVPVHVEKNTVFVEVTGGAQRAHDVMRATMVLDTGASFTTVPAGPAVAAGLPANLHSSARIVTMGVASLQRGRGLFEMDTFAVGPLAIGPVRAAESSLDIGGEPVGLLGVDVLGRTTFVLRSPDAEGGPRLFVAPPPVGLTSVVSPSDPRCHWVHPPEPGAPLDYCVRIRRRPTLDAPKKASAADYADARFKDTLRRYAASQFGMAVSELRGADRCLTVEAAGGVADRRLEIGFEEYPHRFLAGHRLSVVFNLEPGRAVRACVPLGLDAEAFDELVDHLVISSVGVDDDVDPRLCQGAPWCVYGTGAVGAATPFGR